MEKGACKGFLFLYVVSLIEYILKFFEIPQKTFEKPLDNFFEIVYNL